MNHETESYDAALEQLIADNDRMRHQLAVAERQRDMAIVGNAKVVRALDAALQWGEALFAFLPEGMVLPEGVKTAGLALEEAMREVRR